MWRSKLLSAKGPTLVTEVVTATAKPADSGGFLGKPLLARMGHSWTGNICRQVNIYRYGEAFILYSVGIQRCSRETSTWIEADIGIYLRYSTLAKGVVEHHSVLLTAPNFRPQLGRGD